MSNIKPTIFRSNCAIFFFGRRRFGEDMRLVRDLYRQLTNALAQTA